MGRKAEGSAEKVFKNFGKKVDGFVSELKDSHIIPEDRIQNSFNELKRNRETLHSEFSNFWDNKKERFSEVESNLDRAGQELMKAFQTMFSRRNASPSDDI